MSAERNRPSAGSLERVAERSADGVAVADGLLVLFVWFVFALLCASQESDNNQAITALGTFVGFAALVLSLIGLAILQSSSRRELSGFLLLGFIPLAFLPILAFRSLTATNVFWISIFYIFLVASPVLFRAWSLRFQLPASIATIIAILTLSLPIQNWFNIHAIVIVSLSAILSGLILYIRRTGSERRLLNAEAEASRMAVQVSRLQLPRQIWRAVMLQAYLLVVLVFLDFVLSEKLLTQFFLGHLYALIAIGFEIALLNVVKPAYLGLTAMFATALVGVMLVAFGTDVRTTDTLLHTTLPLVYLCFTTCHLSWSLSLQIVLGWLLIIAAITARVISLWQPGLSFDAVVGAALTRYNMETSLLVSCIALSVFVARVIRQYSLANVSTVIEKDADYLQAVGESGSLELRGYEPVLATSRLLVAAARGQLLLWGLVGLGLFSNLLCSISLLRPNNNDWPWVLVGWLVFIVAWLLLLVWQRNQTATSRVWQLGSLIGLFLILWPSVLLISGRSASELWVFWPVCILIGLGGIPWSIAELIPLTATTFIAGIEMIHQLHLGLAGATSLGISTVLSLFISTHTARRLKERQLITNFHSALASASSYREAARILTDYVMSALDARTAIVGVGDRELEVIRSARCFPLASKDWPLLALRSKLTDIVPDDSGVVIRPVNWLPADWAFFDRRFGVLSAVNGILIELNGSRRNSTLLSGVSADELTVLGEGESKQPILIFIVIDIPVVTALRSSELHLVRSLSALTMLRFEVFREQGMRGAYQKFSDAAQAEREYELSTLVHDINNTVQDLTLLCDSALDDLAEGAVVPAEVESGADSLKLQAGDKSKALVPTLRRISIIARSMATVVSDAKRKRELERLQDLTPREVIEVNEVLDDIVSYAIVRAERKRISVRSEGLGASKIWIKISAREHLETILRNLLNNAIMYSNPGTQIVTTLRSDADWVWIEVTDNGPGLSADECKAIFVPGYRGRSALTVPGGLGLGLSQSRRVAESAGGTLDVQSKGAGQGSSFTLQLPRHGAPTIGGTGLSWVLMVDDQPTLTESYAKIARALNLIPVIASSVPEAIAIVEGRGKPAFVLTDLHMGNSDGMDLVIFLRKQFGSNLPILVVSGINDQAVEAKVREMGATDFVAKPIGRRALFARIQSLLPNT